MQTRFGLVLAATVLAACQSKEDELVEAKNEARAATEKHVRAAAGVGEGLSREGRAAGAAIGEGSLEVVQGLSEAFEEKGEAAGETIAKGTAKFARKLEKGLVDGFTTRPLVVSDRLKQNGIRAERAARHDTSSIKVYLIFDKAYKGDLTLFARSDDGKEVGRTKLSVDEPETGKNVLFEFDKLVDLSLAATLELK